MKNTFESQVFEGGKTTRTFTGCAFVKVTDEDGYYFSIVRKGDAAEYIKGKEAEVVKRKDVPPCLCQDFTDGLSSYHDAVYMSGDKFYF